MVMQAALATIRDSKFIVRVFSGLAAILCKLADDNIAALGGNLL